MSPTCRVRDTEARFRGILLEPSLWDLLCSLCCFLLTPALLGSHSFLLFAAHPWPSNLACGPAPLALIYLLLLGLMSLQLLVTPLLVTLGDPTPTGSPSDLGVYF